MAIRTGTVLVKELAATPATPASGDLAIYSKTDGKLYYENDAGTEHAVVGTSDTQTLSGKSFSDLIGATAGINTKLSVAKLGTDAPSTYPNGLSTASVISTNSWPVTGVLLTISQEASRTYTMQLLMSQNQAASYKRHSTDGTTWSAWSRMVFEDDTQTLTNKSFSDLTATRVRVTSVADADLTTTDHGLQIGPDNGYNLAVDAGQSGGWCELQTRDGAGSAGAPIALNGRGGDVILGDSTSTVTAAGNVDMPDLPKGIIAAWTCTSNGAASAAERRQFTFPFTAIAGRTYRVVVSGGLVDSESTVAQSAYCNLRWEQGATVTTASAACGRQIVATPASTNADLMSGVHVEGLITTATAGTVNCGFFIAAANGTNTIRYFATSIPTRVYVEDLGPSVTVGSLTIT